MPYIDSRRGLRAGAGGEDVYHRRACDRVWHGGQCGVWPDFVGDWVVLKRKGRPMAACSTFIFFLFRESRIQQ